MATAHLDSDLAFLGEHLINQIVAWRDEWRATHPLTDERPASPLAAGLAPPSADPPVIPPYPPPEVHLEHVIEDDPEPAVRIDESDRSVEQLDNPNGVLDHQDE